MLSVAKAYEWSVTVAMLVATRIRRIVMVRAVVVLAGKRVVALARIVKLVVLADNSDPMAVALPVDENMVAVANDVTGILQSRIP